MEITRYRRAPSFKKRRSRILHAPGNQHRRQNLIRTPQRLPIPREKLIERHAPCSRRRSQLHLRIQRQQRRNTICRRRRIAQVPRHRAAILNLHRPHFPRRRLERIKTARQGSANHIAPSGQPADPNPFMLSGDAANLTQRSNVDDPSLRQPLAQRRIKIRPPSQNLAARRSQQRNCLVQCFRLEIQGIGPPKRRATHRFQSLYTKLMRLYSTPSGRKQPPMCLFCVLISALQFSHVIIVRRDTCYEPA